MLVHKYLALSVSVDQAGNPLEAQDAAETYINKLVGRLLQYERKDYDYDIRERRYVVILGVTQDGYRRVEDEYDRLVFKDQLIEVPNPEEG